MKKCFLILPVVFATLIFVSCISKKQEIENKTETPEEVTVEISEPEPSSTIEYKTITKAENLYYLEYKLQYPVFENNDILNSEIKESVIKSLEKLIISAKNEWNEADEMRKMTQEDSVPTPPYEYEGSFSIEYGFDCNQNRTMTVLFSIYTYLGGAHGSTEITTITYDLDHNRIISIEEATGYSLEKISRLCYEELLVIMDESDFHDVQWIQDGTEPYPENFSSFSIKENQMTVIFGQYQVAPYAYGIIEVIIPLSK